MPFFYEKETKENLFHFLLKKKKKKNEENIKDVKNGKWKKNVLFTSTFIVKEEVLPAFTEFVAVKNHES